MEIRELAKEETGTALNAQFGNKAAVGTASKKKTLDCGFVEFLTVDEGLCVQILHIGPYNDEPATVALMDAYLKESGYENDLSHTQAHHEIYLADARKIAKEKWKTIIRHPVRKTKVTL